MKSKTFRFHLKDDSMFGREISIPARSKKQAINSILKAEKCPLSAIQHIKKNDFIIHLLTRINK